MAKNKNYYSKKVGKAAVKYAKKNPRETAIAVSVLVIILAVIIAVVTIMKPQLVRELIQGKVDEYLEYVKTYYYDSKDDDADGTNGAPVAVGSVADINEADFSIHFLELGNAYAGDCTLIKCGDTEVLIDAGSRKSSATTITSYVNNYCTDGKLEYVVATHAHQDHIAAFVGNSSKGTKTGILYQFEIGTIIQFARTNATSGIYSEYTTATNACKNKGTEVFTAKDCWYETNGAKKSYTLMDDGLGNTLTLNVLYNYYYEHDTKDENDYSVCTLLTRTYPSGNAKNYLFTGDLEGEGEKYLVANNDLPEVELFKGAHHGSKTSSSAILLSKIKPKNVAVCCCSGATEYTTNKDNIFPTQAFVDRISAYTQNVYCTSLCIDYETRKFTSMNGNIVFYVKDDAMSLYCSENNTPLKDTDWFKANRTAPKSWQ